MKSFVFSFILLLSLTACGRFVETEPVVYQETLCEPWFEKHSIEYSDDDAEREMKKFFRQNNLKVYNLELSADPEAPVILCGTCSCRTGRLVECDVKTEDLDDFRALGFELKNE